VYLVRSGAVVAEAGLDSDGVFQTEVPPGVYSMIAAGSGGFAAYSIQVLPPGDVQLVQLAAVPPANFGALESLMEEHARVRPRLSLSTSEPPRAAGQKDRSRVRATAVYDPLSANGVRLRQDGRLVGRMRRLHLETGQPVSVSPLSVFFIRDGVLIEAATADENGEFAVSGLEPGAYSVVALGPDGFAAFDMLVLPPRAAVLPAALVQGPLAAGDSRASQDVPEMLDGSLVALEDVQEVLLQDDPDMPPLGNPDVEFVGGGGAMGGGAGGTGSTGRTLAKALLGAGIGAGVGAGIGAAIANDGPSSPFSP
jgi:hypothetical protein